MGGDHQALLARVHQGAEQVLVYVVGDGQHQLGGAQFARDGHQASAVGDHRHARNGLTALTGVVVGEAGHLKGVGRLAPDRL